MRARLKPATLAIVAGHCAAWLAFGQPPKFVAADIHAGARTQFPYVRSSPVRAGRYEITNATMVDLVHQAYGVDGDKILGGPNWLEMDRFDIIAKVPSDTTPERLNLMLQSLLAERFKLVLHRDTRPLPAYALVAGKKLQLRQSEGSEDGRSTSGPP